MRGQSTFVSAIAAGVICTLSARAEPPPDRGTIITGQAENDLVTGTDRFYTSGVRLGITLPTGELPGFASDFGHWLWGDGQQRLAFDLSQNIFTRASHRPCIRIRATVPMRPSCSAPCSFSAGAFAGPRSQ